MQTLYKKHLLRVTAQAKKLLAETSAEALLIHAGSSLFYHADDREVPFVTHAHFARFTPTTGPNHLLIIDLNEPLPLLLEFRPADFWEEQIDTSPTFWRECIPSQIVKSTDELKNEILSRVGSRSVITIGSTQLSQQFKTWGILLQDSEDLILKLDHDRVIKTPYEIECLEEATKRAVVGHKKLQEMFKLGATEREMYYAFLENTNMLPNELPYEPIIALNEKSATLHYRNKQSEKTNGSVLLVDAGVSVHGYASDVTRTMTTPNAHPVFQGILHDLDILQQKLCDEVRPEIELIELHDKAHRGIAKILVDHKVLTCTEEEAHSSGLTHPFFPHGLGHMLGLQVHDVGNASKLSENHPLRKKYPRVRTNRKLEVGMVTTIEPGIYFIPMLLQPLRAQGASIPVNWKLIDELIPFGGMRIEDNLVVTESGSENLTRKYF